MPACKTGTMPSPRRRDRLDPTGSVLYNAAAMEASAVVIRRYSTSFSAASRLLGASIRPQIEAIYALVRLADEVVDGSATDAGVPAEKLPGLLDELERDVERAVDEGFSLNPIVHAFALVARGNGIDPKYISAFFASMRMDLTVAEHDAVSFEKYIYGSAEVVGLMCTAVFLHGENISDADRARAETGARRLGHAFQVVNFLRDVGDDRRRLGRSYFPGTVGGHLSEGDKERILDEIDADLAAAKETLPLLPTSSRRAVALALAVFADLAERLWPIPVASLGHTRVSVPNSTKVKLAALAAAGRLG